MAMKMTKVIDCTVGSCSYNSNKRCHTMAITVGQGDEPLCDTFTDFRVKGGDVQMIAGVGACKMSDCTFNKDLECSADVVHVGLKGGHPDCISFKRA